MINTTVRKLERTIPEKPTCTIMYCSVSRCAYIGGIICFTCDFRFCEYHYRNHWRECEYEDYRLHNPGIWLPEEEDEDEDFDADELPF